MKLTADISVGAAPRQEEKNVARPLKHIMLDNAMLGMPGTPFARRAAPLLPPAARTRTRRGRDRRGTAGGLRCPRDRRRSTARVPDAGYCGTGGGATRL